MSIAVVQGLDPLAPQRPTRRPGQPLASGALSGFRESASGLIVPGEVARERQVMTWQEWRDLEKVTKSLAARGIVLQLKCADPRCQKTPIQRHRTPEGGISFRCEHRDLIYTRKF